MARSTQTDAIATLTAQVAALTEMVAAMSANTPATPATPARKTRASKPGKGKPAKGAKVYTWKPWACAKFGIPSIVGASFAYSGKNGTTDHIVTAVSADGIVSSVRA